MNSAQLQRVLHFMQRKSWVGRIKNSERRVREQPNPTWKTCLFFVCVCVWYACLYACFCMCVICMSICMFLHVCVYTYGGYAYTFVGVLGNQLPFLFNLIHWGRGSQANSELLDMVGFGVSILWGLKHRREAMPTWHLWRFLGIETQVLMPCGKCFNHWSHLLSPWGTYSNSPLHFRIALNWSLLLFRFSLVGHRDLQCSLSSCILVWREIIGSSGL